MNYYFIVDRFSYFSIGLLSYIEFVSYWTMKLGNDYFYSCSLLFTAKCRKADELFRSGESPGSVAANLDNMAVVATAGDSDTDVTEAPER